jgi:hypothetical protein
MFNLRELGRQTPNQIPTSQTPETSTESAIGVIKAFRYEDYETPALTKLSDLSQIEQNRAFMSGFYQVDQSFYIKGMPVKICDKAVQCLTEEYKKTQDSYLLDLITRFNYKKDYVAGGSNIGTPDFYWFRENFDELPDTILLPVQEEYLKLTVKSLKTDPSDAEQSDSHYTSPIFIQFGEIGNTKHHAEEVQRVLSQEKYKDQTIRLAKDVFKTLEKLALEQFEKVWHELYRLIRNDKLEIASKHFQYLKSINYIVKIYPGLLKS